MTTGLPSRVGLPGADWRQQLEHITTLMQDISRETDPQKMVARYGAGMQNVIARDRLVALSRRNLEAPRYRITRSDLWDTPVNPWRNADRLPEFDHGILGELLYAGEARVLDTIDVPADDPAAEYFAGMKSGITVPTWDEGEVLNMVLMMRREPNAYSPEDLPQAVWMANLFGRATKNLVLSHELDRAYARLDEELRVVADIQRSLLPGELPRVQGLDVAAYYETSQYAGGDYYDFFPLVGGKLGILVADVCGHGTPAAVLMAITHSLAHTFPGEEPCPGGLLEYVNRHLAARYIDRGAFVTAFFGVYDPEKRTLRYSSAGHNPPRVKRCADGRLFELDEARNLPLGILHDTKYEPATVELEVGDQVIFYTDGITEARGGKDGNELFGIKRLDAVMENCAISSQGLIDTVLASVAEFTEGRPADDDRTMVIARVT
jgi:sigma-B regulation protein RsbU (phosphoserine phosphatase)